MRKQTKVVAVASAAALLAIGASMTSFAATGWVEEDGTWYFYDKDGNPITDLENQVVSTGMMVTLEYKTNVYDRAYIAVRGENTLDGRIDVDDLDLLDRQILGLSKYPNDSLIFKVSDVVESEKIDVDDSDKVEQYILGKIKTLN